MARDMPRPNVRLNRYLWRGFAHKPSVLIARPRYISLYVAKKSWIFYISICCAMLSFGNSRTSAPTRLGRWIVDVEKRERRDHQCVRDFFRRDQALHVAERHHHDLGLLRAAQARPPDAAHVAGHERVTIVGLDRGIGMDAAKLDHIL